MGEQSLPRVAPAGHASQAPTAPFYWEPGGIVRLFCTLLVAVLALAPTSAHAGDKKVGKCCAKPKEKKKPNRGKNPDCFGEECRITPKGSRCRPMTQEECDQLEKERGIPMAWAAD